MTHDDDKYKITYTKSDIKDRAQDFLVERTFYACNRFLKAPEILQAADEVLLTDIDCFLRKPIEWEYFKDCDYSLYLRDPLPGTVGWEKEGSRVGAGAVSMAKSVGIAATAYLGASGLISAINSSIDAFARQ